MLKKFFIYILTTKKFDRKFDYNTEEYLIIETFIDEKYFDISLCQTNSNLILKRDGTLIT